MLVDVGVERVRAIAASSGSWVSSTVPVSSAISARCTTCGIGSNPGGTDGHPDLRAGQQQRVRHVVPVPEVREHAAGERRGARGS